LERKTVFAAIIFSAEITSFQSFFLSVFDSGLSERRAARAQATAINAGYGVCSMNGHQ
jgi:hypothetical protein